jgi:hypothetical protein
MSSAPAYSGKVSRWRGIRSAAGNVVASIDVVDIFGDKFADSYTPLWDDFQEVNPGVLPKYSLDPDSRNGYHCNY